jgi:hypothetical protein
MAAFAPWRQGSFVPVTGALPSHAGDAARQLQRRAGARAA